MKDTLPHNALDEMLVEMQGVPETYIPSPYWEEINKKHIHHVKEYGIRYFKRFINKQYFDWEVGGILRHQISPFVSEILKGNIQPLWKSKFIDKTVSWKPFYKYQFLSKIFYARYVAYLFDYVSRIDSLHLLKNLSEPRVGSPLLVQYKRRLISQDLCNSIYEFYSITKEIDVSDSYRIAEIGAGYGRLAYVFLKTIPQTRYCIIDVPPALFIAQEYLKIVFPKEKIFTFRHFQNYEEIQQEFEESRIQILMPHQIELLPRNLFDITLNISSLQEMSTIQIKNYFQQANRLTKGYFYTKQWKKSHTKDNNFITEEEYPIPRSWIKIYKKTHPIQRDFFEALYKTKDKDF